MLQLDHLVIIAPTLEAGAAHVYNELGVEMSPGGKHPQMGTHNLLLRLGDEVLLEVIAIDPAARPPSRPRWFGLDDSDHVRNEWDAGRRLRAWVAQTDDIGTVLRSHSDLLGEATPVSRGERTWRFTLRHDGQLPAGGIVPR
ncbi:MAG TPA: VOC family protein [Candidatus Agrococcus pullicola]|uniref:VOC family protein n=1 Tax=Candidatus Agrococcus pullicola TaxID=2838429 RepID=A0A9D1YT48_9MICO|nr:VOC family protein [Candidatus Agrococcus pullicola]